jgi:transposase
MLDYIMGIPPYIDLSSHGGAVIGKRDSQVSLLAGDAQYLAAVGRDSFYGFLALHRDRLFRDEDFADLYCPDNGRTSVPPSILAIALLLQAYDRVSDDEVVQRATFDLRWSVALGTEPGKQPFAKSTFQAFRAKLILNDRAQAIFERSLRYAREVGFLKNRKMKTSLDTTYILGKGAVKDTYNLLADGIRKVVRTLEKLSAKGLRSWLRGRRQRYFSKSFKGASQIDWDDPTARQQLLKLVVEDVDTLLELAQQTEESLEEPERHRLRKATRLLRDVVAQDIERSPDSEPRIKQGVAQDRIVSVHDPEMRHGRKSQSQRFDGHKATVAVDTDTQLITAVDVIAGNAYDSDNALELVKATEENTGAEVEAVIGDSAFGTAKRRKEFSEANKDLIAKVASPPNRGTFPKEDFQIDLEKEAVTCPAGHTTTTWIRTTYRSRDGTRAATKMFLFDSSCCRQCPLYSQCVRSTKGRGRTILLHPDEAVLQAARAFQKTEEFKEQYRLRMVVEHRLARLIQLSGRKSRYFGRKKTAFQMAMAAAVANFTLIATWQAQNPDFSASILWLAVIFTLMILWRSSKTSVATYCHGHRT